MNTNMKAKEAKLLNYLVEALDTLELTDSHIMSSASRYVMTSVWDRLVTIEENKSLDGALKLGTFPEPVEGTRTFLSNILNCGGGEIAITLANCTENDISFKDLLEEAGFPKPIARLYNGDAIFEAYVIDGILFVVQGLDTFGSNTEKELWEDGLIYITDDVYYLAKMWDMVEVEASEEDEEYEEFDGNR